jgi:hypothetical protein
MGIKRERSETKKKKKDGMPCIESSSEMGLALEPLNLSVAKPLGVPATK